MKRMGMGWRIPVAAAWCLGWIGALAFAEPSADPPSTKQHLEKLQPRIDEALGTVQRRYLSAERHTPWQIMHGVLALGYDMQLVEGPDRHRLGAIDYICQRDTIAGQRILQPTAHGVRFIDSVDAEGHPDQFLAYFAQAGVAAETKLQVNEQTFTVADLIKEAQAQTGQHAETTFTLIGISHYLGSDAQWYNQKQQRYSIKSLLDWELRQSVASGACGGTHRLTAISLALDRSREKQQTLEGVWLRAQQKIDHYLQRSRQFQNSDGCFSSEFFEGTGWTEELEDRLHAHGHTLEWVARAVGDEELSAPWVTRAVDHLCDTLIEHRRTPLECGALYHAASALKIYQARLQARAKTAPALAGSTPAPRHSKPSPQGR